MNDLFQTHHAPARAIVQRIDPRSRILAATGFAVLVVGLDRFAALGAALAVGLVLMLLSGLPPGRTLKRMAGMDGFIVVMLVMLPFTVPGEALFTVAGFPASSQGIRQALTIALQANAIVLTLMALVGSMESATLGHALHRLGVPANLVHLLAFTVRYIEVIHQEYLRLRTAMKTRGFRPGSNRHTWRSFGYLIGMMLIRALERSERILQAMKCRGFVGRIPVLCTLRYGWPDALFAATLSGAALLLLWLEIGHDTAF